MSRMDTQPSTDIKTIITQADATKVVKQILITLLVVQVFMIFADVFLNFYGWVGDNDLQRSFNITREDSIQNWFAAMMTMSIAVTLYFIHYLNTKGIPAVTSGINKIAWLLFGIFFTYLSMDDGSRLHERVGGVVQDALLGTEHWFDIAALQTFPSYVWQIVYVPTLALCFVLFFIYVGKKIYQKSQINQLYIAASLLVLAVVLDFIEGLDELVYPELHFQKLFEESMEVCAMIIILNVLLTYVVSLLYRNNK